MFWRGTASAKPAEAQAPPAEPAVAAAAEEANRTAPEPLSLVLPAVAALGAIASIAAVAWVAQDRTAERPRVKRRIDVILRDLEIASLGIAEILRRMLRHSRRFGLEGSTSAVAPKFGLGSQRVDVATGQLYHQLVNDMATMLVLATQNSFDAINAIEDGEIQAPEEVFFGFGEAQQKLNALLAQRAGVRSMVEGCVGIGEQLTGLIRQLKQYKVN